MDKKLSETTYLCVEIMNSKRQVYCKGETWSRGTNLRLTLDVTWCLTSLTNLFSLYVLFSQYRSCDWILKCFFQISSCSRAYTRTKRQVPVGPLCAGIQNIQAKEPLYLAIQCNTKTRGGGGLLKKCLNGEAPPRGPTPYHLYTIFHEKGTPPF